MNVAQENPLYKTNYAQTSIAMVSSETKKLHYSNAHMIQIQIGVLLMLFFRKTFVFSIFLLFVFLELSGYRNLIIELLVIANYLFKKRIFIESENSRTFYQFILDV